MPSALSPQNPRIERVRELRTPKVRRERGLFTLEGPTLLAEARRSGLAVAELYGTEVALAEHRLLVEAVESAGTQVFSLPDKVIARLSDVETPTGLLAVAPMQSGDAATVLARPGTVLLLAGVNDPGNAGTLLRSAEAFGAAGVLFGRGGVDPYSPKVVRAAMGSLFRLPVAQTEAEELLAAAAAAGRPVIAATLEGEPLRGATVPDNAIIAVGNERHGVGGFLPRWDRGLRIEQASETESLNAAVAGSILLYMLSIRR